jgi:hypothetical protein
MQATKSYSKVEVQFHSFLTSAMGEGGGQRHAPAILYSGGGGTPGTQRIKS